MTSESPNSLLIGNGFVNTFPRKRTRNNIRAVFSEVRFALIATQRCGKHISSAVNQHVKIEDAVFSVGAAPRLYNEDVTQLEGEMRELSSAKISEKEMAVAAEN
jgi:hypothetical protein